MEATRRQRVVRSVVLLAVGIGGAALVTGDPLGALRVPAFAALAAAMAAWTFAENMVLEQDEPAAYRHKLQTRLMQGAVILGVAVGAFEHVRLPPTLPRTAAVTAAGIALVVAGGALRVWAIRTMREHFSYELRVEKGARIVDTGPYRLLRHPSYLGILLITLGGPLALASAWGLAAGALAMGVMIVLRVRSEEAVLREAFGAAYDAYAARTWRIVPYVW